MRYMCDIFWGRKLAKRLGAVVIFGCMVMLFGSCSLLNIVQKKLNEGEIKGGLHWRVDKIIVDNQEYQAPQVLAKIAQDKLQNKLNDTIDDNNDSTPTHTPNDTSDDIPDDNLADSAESKATQSQTTLQELAEIDGIATMDFDEKNGRISGSSGCSAYFASYTWTEKTIINITPGGQTRKICKPNEVMRFDFRFIRELEGSFIVLQPNDKSMILKGKQMQVFLSRQEAPDMTE